MSTKTVRHQHRATATTQLQFSARSQTWIDESSSTCSEENQHFTCHNRRRNNQNLLYNIHRWQWQSLQKTRGTIARLQRISFLTKNWQNDDNWPSWRKYWFLTKFDEIGELRDLWQNFWRTKNGIFGGKILWSLSTALHISDPPLCLHRIIRSIPLHKSITGSSNFVVPCWAGAMLKPPLIIWTCWS